MSLAAVRWFRIYVFSAHFSDNAPRGLRGKDNHGTSVCSALSCLVISKMKVLKRKHVESEGLVERDIRFWDG